jgi:hypothetical protein
MVGFGTGACQVCYDERVARYCEHFSYSEAACTLNS